MAKREVETKIYKKKRRPLLFLLKLAGVLLLLFLCAGFGLFIYYVKDMPRPEKFTEGTVAQSSKIYDRTGTVLLYEISGTEKRTVVSLDEIPQHLKDAIITTEDANFYRHPGVDIRAVFRAVLRDLKLGHFAQGASTISQQLIRSYFLTTKKTIARKTREVVLALELERRYSKEQILEWYLNIIPFGENLYGIEAASQRFFQKHVSDVSLAESALLAAMIQAPSRLSPYGPNLQDLLNRKDFILGRMLEAGQVSQEEKIAAQQETIVFSQSKDIIKAPHFAIYVRNQLLEKYGEKYLTSRGLKIYTTLDYDLQIKAEEIVRQGVENVKGYNAHNGALAAVDPKTGEVLVMVGSKDFYAESFPEDCSPGIDCLFDPEVNITMSQRQPGSAFKPFVYAAALQKGFTPDSIIWDVKTEFNTGCQTDAEGEKDEHGYDCYHPQNYDEKYIGPVTLRLALAQSRNLPAVKVLYLAELNKALELAEDCGINTLKREKDYGLSLVLGGGEVRLLEMAGAYSVFANDGFRAPLRLIQKIENIDGEIIEQMKVNPIKVISSQVTRQINDILSDNEARAPMFGWYSRLYVPGYDVAAKTGTTQFLNDAWTIGYSPSIVVGAWVGNNNNESTTKPGVTLAGPIWRNFIDEALKKFSNQKFQEPNEVITGKPILDGVVPEEPHSILHFLDKNHPQDEGDSQDDIQYKYWEYGVQKYWNSNSANSN